MPAASAARRSARTRRAGCTVAHSRKKTPRRNTGDSMRAASARSSSPTASSAAPTSSAARTAASIAASWDGVVDTINMPPSRSQTSGPNARTAGMMPSPARASSNAASVPSSVRSSPALAQ
jgi:hypothetical protein